MLGPSPTDSTSSSLLMRRPRIAFYSDASHLGGAEVVLAELVHGLTSEFRVSVLATRAAVLEHLTDGQAGIAAELLPPVRNKGDLAGLVRHRRVIERMGADVFHANLSMPTSCQYAILAASSVRGLKLVGVENSPVWSRRASAAWLKRLASARLDAHVAVGERTARTVESEAGLPPGSIRVINPGIADRGVAEQRSWAEPVVIGTVARLWRVKGVDVVIDAVARLAGVRLIVVGDGPEEESLRAQIRRLGLEGRTELRSVPFDGTARDLIGSFDIFALGSRQEGFPVTVMEAMFAAVPVVATDAGSVREQVVDGETGLVVAAEDPAALAGALERLAGDRDLRERMGRAGRRRAHERFTVDRMVSAYERLYVELLAI